MRRADIMLQGNSSAYEVLYRFVALFSQDEGYSTLFFEELQLTMKEAFVNAVKHGNKERGDLNVSITLTASAEVLLASVRDCGKGFNLDELPNPVDPRNLFRLSGRGLYIIRSIAEIIACERDGDGWLLTLRFHPSWQ
ncbi:MAG: ATP-binding protein [Pelodictyon phaeoclathratiforme]